MHQKINSICKRFTKLIMNDVSLVNLDKDDKKANTVTTIKSFKD